MLFKQMSRFFGVGGLPKKNLGLALSTDSVKMMQGGD